MGALSAQLPASWRQLLEPELDWEKFRELEEFVAAERSRGPVFPPEDRVFAALELTPPERAKVLILGQDPYHDDCQAHGLAFSVPENLKFPPSLRNIFKELQSDLGFPSPASGNLESWARQGVLLLNAVLTVRPHQAGSHQKKGWEPFTDAIIRALNRRSTPLVFVLWGAQAQAKIPLIDETRHRIIATPHPSPLSAHRGFFGSRPFSRINAALAELGQPPVDWQLDRVESLF